MGRRMRAADLRTKVIPALLSGTSRQPLRLEGTALAEVKPLQALSLAGQLLRFESRPAPQEFAVEPQFVDERRIMPESVRKPLMWLLRSRNLMHDVELALAWSFARLNLRPHPFDLPRMATFVKAHAEELGTTAQVWAAGESSTSGKSMPENFFFGTEELDETNWTSAQPARRVTFVMNQRREDSERGLALVRSVWGQEDADMRFRLLGALAGDLKATDKEFLEESRKDRAPRVRDLAQRLLCRLPGAVGWHPALSACLERIEKTSSGLLRSKTVLKLDLPATVKEHQAKAWIRESFAEVSCEELARGLDLAETAMVEAAAKDANLLLAMALMATTDGRLDLMQLIVKRLPDAWEAMAQSGPLQMDAMPPAERLRWAEILINPYGKTPPFLLAVWVWMHRAIRGPMPAALIESVLRSSLWSDKLQQVKGSEWMELLAASCPSGQRAGLRLLLGAFEPTQNVTALALLDILDGLEKG